MGDGQPLLGGPMLRLVGVQIPIAIDGAHPEPTVHFEVVNDTQTAPKSLRDRYDDRGVLAEYDWHRLLRLCDRNWLDRNGVYFLTEGVKH